MLTTDRIAPGKNYFIQACRKDTEHHGRRRNLVWAELGESPLAVALEPLAILAEVTKVSLAAGTVHDLANGYRNHGWKADNAVMCALACVETNEDFKAVSTSIRTVYRPWVEESASYLQKIVDGANYPGGTCLTAKPYSSTQRECLLFVDGLRFDTGKRLAEMLDCSGFDVTEELSWTPLPSVTATGKAAVTPVRDKIQGQDNNVDFEPAVAETGQSLKGGY